MCVCGGRGDYTWVSKKRKKKERKEKHLPYCRCLRFSKTINKYIELKNIRTLLLSFGNKNLPLKRNEM